METREGKLSEKFPIWINAETKESGKRATLNVHGFQLKQKAKKKNTEIEAESKRKPKQTAGRLEEKETFVKKSGEIRRSGKQAMEYERT